MENLKRNQLPRKSRQLPQTEKTIRHSIEDLIERENTFTMDEFAASVNEFLSFRRYEILPDKGRVFHKKALEKAAQEYDVFNKTQRITSDFDKAVALLSGGAEIRKMYLLLFP